jgi:hypothetical protein
MAGLYLQRSGKGHMKDERWTQGKVGIGRQCSVVHITAQFRTYLKMLYMPIAKFALNLYVSSHTMVKRNSQGICMPRTSGIPTGQTRGHTAAYQIDAMGEKRRPILAVPKR